MKRRASASLTLVLIGAALQGCGDEPATARDLYRTQGDCRRDWGDETAKCEPIRSGPHSGYYYGPSYSSRHTDSGTSAPRTGSHAVSTHVSRGGFGSSASSHSSGG